MTDPELRTLKKELQQAGAKDTELRELLVLAADLSQLQRKHSRRRGFLKLAKPYSITALASIAAGMVLVISAQTVLPGNILYPIQKATDSVVIKLDPSYRGSVMMKRADQVKQLVVNHAKTSDVLASLDNYQAEAKSYKSAASNYAAFEYCKNSLKQAAANAPQLQRQAIDSILQSLDDS